MPSRLTLTLVACASALALAACKDDAAPKPAVYDFANAPPAAVGVNAPAAYDGYALAERAHAFDRIVYREAPSYGFRYGDEEPWAWRTVDDYSMYAEPYDDGYRSYYYAPGADYPYFIRDDDYGYGYGPDGVLVAVYDSYGELLPEDRLYVLASLAGVYLMRASVIRQYALDDSYRIAVSQDYWSARAPRYYEAQQVWYTAPERQPQWREWRASHERDVASFIPRGEVRRWRKADDNAWKAYEQADRKAWKAEDQARRNAERQGQRVALATQPPAPNTRDVREGRQDRGGDRKGEQRAARRDEVRLQEARVEAPRESGRQGNAGRGRDRDRAEAAIDHPRPAREVPNRRQQMQRAEAPQAIAREHGGGRQARIANAEPPRPQPAPPREHGGNGQAEARRQAQAAPPPVQAAPSAPPQQHQARGKPDRGAAPAPQADHGQGGGKPEAGKGQGKDKKD